MSALMNVIQAELFKAVRKKRTYVMTALLWVLLPVLILIVGRVLLVTLGTDFVDNSSPIGAADVVQIVASPFGIARIGLMLPALLSPPFYILVVALLAALFIGEERSQNMWKTTLVAQPNRLAVLFGKFIVAMVIFGVILFGMYLLSFVYGAIGMLFLPTNFSGEWLSLLGLYALQWLFGIAAMSFAFLMIWWLKNISLGIVTVFFLPVVLEGIYTIYATTVGFQPLNRINSAFQLLRLRKTLEDLPTYFFTRNLYAPSREPLNSVLSGLDINPTDADLGPLANLIGGVTLQSAAIVMAAYTVLFGGILVWRFLRRDVS